MTGITYEELVGLRQEQFRTTAPLYHKRSYNVRGQLTEMRLGTYHATDAGWWQTILFYEYDSLNRLASDREMQNDQDLWTQDYDYDRWGAPIINQTNT